MEITTGELLSLLGAKEAELYLLRKRVGQLEQEGQRQVTEFAERLNALETERTPKDA